MEHADFLDRQIAGHAEVLARTGAAVREPFQRLTSACIAALAAGGKILLFGNGGSAGDSQHLAAELVVRFRVNRRALAAIALTTDTSILTACANDYSFDAVFARQIEALGRPGDVAIALSTSGNSPNILRALETARSMGLVAAGLGGRDGGAMVGLADPLLVVPSPVTSHIQEMHMLIGHTLCDLIEAAAAETSLT